MPVTSYGSPTFVVRTGAQACAGGKLFLSILNPGPGPIILDRLHLKNAALVAQVGIQVQFDLKRISAVVGGAALVPEAMDTSDALPGGLTIVSNATSATEGAIIVSHYTNNDEVGATNGFPSSFLQSMENLLPVSESPLVKPFALRAGEGITLKQITATVVGFFDVYAIFHT